MTAGGTFTQAKFNLFNAASDTSSTAISVYCVAQTFGLGDGQNFFGFSAVGGDTISSISFNTNSSGGADLRQLRVGGVAGRRARTHDLCPDAARLRPSAPPCTAAVQRTCRSLP